MSMLLCWVFWQKCVFLGVLQLCRWPKCGRGWQEERRSQHFLSGLWTFIWALPEVRPPLVWTRPCQCHLQLLYFYFLFFLLQNNDALCPSTHQNPCQVLVPQKLPLPLIQGKIGIILILIAIVHKHSKSWLKWLLSSLPGWGYFWESGCTGILVYFYCCFDWLYKVYGIRFLTFLWDM